jgi:tetratricopeptide (TPR) repeat protein
MLGGAAILIAVVAAIAWSLRPRPDPQRLWVQAELALRAGRWNDARALLARIERLRSKTVHDLMLEAQLAAARDDSDAALRALARVPADDTLYPQAELMAGRLERARKRIRFAESHYRKAIDAQPDLIEAHKELIYIYGVQLRRREIDAEFRALGKLTRLTHHDLFTWSLTHFSFWSPDIADDLQSFVDADPEDRGSRVALAKVLLDQPSAGKRVLQVIDRLPTSDVEGIAVRVGLALHEGRLGDAQAILEGAPQNHPELARYRGRLALFRNDPAAAAHYFRLAVSSDPYDRVSLADIGLALNRTGEKAAADGFLAKVKRLNRVYNLVMRVRSPEKEDRAPDLIELGRACEDAGLAEEASHWYTLAIARDPLDPRAQRGLYRLRTTQAATEKRAMNRESDRVLTGSK